MADYLDILREWERNVANPIIYEHLDSLFPAYCFRRIQAGSKDDHWASPFKKDLSLPKKPNKEKTVVYANDLFFREQGEWDNKIAIIDKLKEDNGLNTIYEAYVFAAERLGISVPKNGSGNLYDTKSTSQRLLEKLEAYFKWNLHNNTGTVAKDVRKYLNITRGFSEEDIETLGFGLVPAWDKVEAYITNPRQGFSLEDLKFACEVRSVDGYTSVGKEYILSIPFRSGGKIKGFLFRSINSDTQPKYIANKNLDRKTSFFNISTGYEAKTLVVMEGELDALTAASKGISGAVAIGGAYLSGERRAQICDAFNRNVQKITLCLDLDKDKDGNPDYAKRFNANRRSIISILDIKPDFKELYVAEFPKPCDPDEFIREMGSESFLRLLSSAKPWWQYLSDNITKF